MKHTKREVFMFQHVSNPFYDRFTFLAELLTVQDGHLFQFHSVLPLNNY
jgi:hypothetical protein